MLNIADIDRYKMGRMYDVNYVTVLRCQYFEYFKITF